jgi:hypothetical protein
MAGVRFAPPLPNACHLPIGGGVDDVGITFDLVDAQQPEVIGRLLGGRNPQPIMIRIKVGQHRAPQPRFRRNSCFDWTPVCLVWAKARFTDLELASLAVVSL